MHTWYVFNVMPFFVNEASLVDYQANANHKQSFFVAFYPQGIENLILILNYECTCLIPIFKHVSLAQPFGQHSHPFSNVCPILFSLGSIIAITNPNFYDTLGLFIKLHPTTGVFTFEFQFITIKPAHWPKHRTHSSH